MGVRLLPAFSVWILFDLGLGSGPISRRFVSGLFCLNCLLFVVFSGVLGCI